MECAADNRSSHKTFPGIRRKRTISCDREGISLLTRDAIRYVDNYLRLIRSSISRSASNREVDEMLYFNEASRHSRVAAIFRRF